MSEFKKDQNGVERCQNIKQIVIENVKGDASKGYHYVKAYCNRPGVMSIADNRKMCPDCEKPAPIGNVHPRVTNAAGTTLTPAELKECGLDEDPSLNAAPAKKVRAPRQPKEAKPAVEAKVKKEIRKDAVEILISLDLLEQSTDIAATLIKGAIDGMDKLPVTNFAESKRLIRLQEKLEALMKA